MKLAYSPSSPYVRKVMAVLHETGQITDVETSRPVLNPLDFDLGLVAKNPLAKVPTLTLEDGSILYDSRVICGYLNERAGAQLYGSGASHWTIRTLEATADGILDAAFIMVCEVRFRPEDKQWDAWMDGQWARIAHACTALNAHWMAHLRGPLTIGHIAVACALGYLDLRHDARGWRTGNDALAAWYQDFESRPSMVATRAST